MLPEQILGEFINLCRVLLSSQLCNPKVSTYRATTAGIQPALRLEKGEKYMQVVSNYQWYGLEMRSKTSTLQCWRFGSIKGNHCAAILVPSNSNGDNQKHSLCK